MESRAIEEVSQCRSIGRKRKEYICRYRDRVEF